MLVHELQIHLKQLEPERPLHLTAALIVGPESERQATYATDVESCIHRGDHLTNRIIPCFSPCGGVSPDQAQESETHLASS